MRQGYQKSFQQQSTFFVTVSCQHRWVQLQTLAKMTSPPGPSCGQTWSNVVLQVLLIVSAWTCVMMVQWKWQPQVTVRDIGQLLRGESFIFLYINTLFPTLKEFASQTWLPKLLLKWCHHLIHRLICAVFMHPNTCYQTLLNGLTAHNCHSYLYTTHY